MTLSVEQRVTLLKIDDAMALTHRYELEIRQVLEPAPVGYEGRKQRVAIARQRGKRREQYLDLAADDILLDGWNQPFQTDQEAGGVFSGNACYNLVGNAEAIHHAIETKGVLPVSDNAKAKILVSAGPRTQCDDSDTTPLYPKLETGHAVMNRIKAALANRA